MDETWRSIYESLSTSMDCCTSRDFTYSASTRPLSGYYESLSKDYWGVYHSPRPIKVKPKSLNEIEWE